MADAATTTAPKRKATPEAAFDDIAGKRARLDHDDDFSPSANGARNGTAEGTTDGPARTDAGRDPSAGSPPRARPEAESQARRPSDQRRPSTTSGPPIRRQVTLEEKKRGQRLFGNLVSTLSRTASGPQQQRRLDIGRRQQERAQQRRAEDERRRAERPEDVARSREIEQLNLDERAMHTRHRTILSRARNLVTRSEPKIAYLPYKLTRHQEDILEDQIREAEETIARERREFKLRKEQRLRELGVEPPVRSPSPLPPREQHEPPKAEEEPEMHPPSASDQATVGEPKPAPQDTNLETVVATAPTEDQAQQQQPPQDKEHDEHGDEMVQDEEDVVIY
ncbi:hypothetical protein VTJ83DRAFT_991 [Remersonia thermophila]|uniref:Pinin/SDK/MemA protein domain-containing protein n=1 Tax=Remersonia thermophila TaxID=72144 RepID=A0ABR4DNC6_9PEZI